MQIVDQLIQWVELHPDYGLFLTFIMAFSESLIVVGGLIPGSIAITGIGILAGSGILSIHTTFLFAIIGAIMGDTISFFIGRHFKDNLKDIFIFRHYPKTLNLGKHYFKLHGGKSVFLGRFIGPIRAIVPAIAGMMNMPIHYFILANVTSAIGWSALFYFPGVLIGRGHEQIQTHFQQIFVSLVIFITPIVILYLISKFKFQVYKRKGYAYLNFYQKLLGQPLFRFVTPLKTSHSHYKTLTELCYLAIILIGFISSYWFSKSLLNLSNFSIPQWLKHQNSIVPVLLKISFLNDYPHMLVLIVLFSLFMITTRHLHLFKTLGLLLLTSLIFDALLNYSLNPSYSLLLSTINPFIVCVALQYLWLRILVFYKPYCYWPLTLVLITAWNMDTLLLSVQEQTPWIPYLFSGLLVGQLSWMHARFKSYHIDYASGWLALLVIEMFISLLF